ncbi:MAG: CHASE2 domain-containing protein, partial [Armatimonadetes bacterium]|nr:CHASE2 domain-containing protein [Armatimonadota bacterium]
MSSTTPGSRGLLPRLVATHLVWGPLLAVVLLLAVARAFRLDEPLYGASLEWLMRYAPARVTRPDPRIVIIALDDETFAHPEEVPQWAPNVLERSQHGLLLGEVARSGGRVVGFDIAFLGESPMDGAFRQALDAFPGTVVLVAEAATVFAPGKGDERTNRAQGRFEEPTAHLTGAGCVRIASPLVKEFPHNRIVFGVTPVQARGDGRAIQALAYECWLAATGRSPDPRLTADPGGIRLIRWPAAPVGEGFRRISYREVVTGRWRQQDPDLFRDRIVLVGSFATGAGKDYVRTPHGAAPGVVVHAAILQTWLEGTPISHASRFLPTALLAALSAAFVFRLVFRSPPIQGLVISVAALALTYLVSLGLYHAGIWVSHVHAWVTIGAFGLGAYLLSTRFAQNMLARYAGEAAAEQLRARGRIVQRTQVATVFFADVQGYTTLSESLSPAELMEV